MVRRNEDLDRFAETSAPRKSAKVPFDFVLEALASLAPTTRPMFGCTAVYVGERIVMILRKKVGDDFDSGVWLATTEEHHDALRAELPSMRSIAVFGPGVSGWQNLPETADDFEDQVLRACSMVRAGDVRIGKVPKAKGAKKTAAKKTADARPAAKKTAAKKTTAKKTTAKKTTAKKTSTGRDR